MELTSILLWGVLAFLGYRVWIWWKTNGSFQQILDHLRYRIRFGLRAGSVKELEAVQDNLLRLDHQVHALLSHVKTAEKSLHQLQICSQEIEPPFVPFEQSGDASSSMDISFSPPRSIVRNGLRFTLSDSIWSHMGVATREDLDDGQVQAMVQGPFCRICLKRLVGRDRVRVAVVPAQCRHCGFSWSNQGSNNLSISLLELKRQVYDSLDRELRSNRRVQCEA
jgi:hypothetical protein